MKGAYNAGPHTNFALPISTAMSFNRTLWSKTAQQIAREARSWYNEGNLALTYWTPVINLARDPRWGRNLETPGEDPMLSGAYAEAFVRGFQEAPEAPGTLLAGATCKHFVANSMEKSSDDGITFGRENFDAIVNQRDLVDSYLAPFQVCVEKGNAAGLMCSYNSVNGFPACAWPWLLNTTARAQWKFDGYITGDCGAARDTYSAHHFAQSPTEAVRDTLSAGMVKMMLVLMLILVLLLVLLVPTLVLTLSVLLPWSQDNDCGNMVNPNHTMEALNASMITEALIDKRVGNLFRVRFRMGLFDAAPNPLDKITNATTVCTPYSAALSRDGMAQSATLLKNAGKRLPLSAADIKRAAVIGPMSAAPNVGPGGDISRYYGPLVSCGEHFFKHKTMVNAISEHVANTVNASGDSQWKPLSGCKNFKANATDVAAAVEQAKVADLVVVVLGSDLSNAAEGHDLANMSIPDAQWRLYEAVTAAAKNPVVVVMITANALDISAILNDDKVGAVVHAGMPSDSSLGVGDVLFGKKVPAGRMIQTVYPTGWQGSLSIMDMGMRPGKSDYPRPDCGKRASVCKKNPSACGNRTECTTNATNAGRTHRFFTGKAAVPFGFGLSYTTFKYSVASSSDNASAPVSLEPVRDLLARHAGRPFPPLREVDALGALVSHRVTVTNTGALDADDVVLGFLKPPGAGVGGVPLQTLYDFARVHVKAGQSRTVTLNATALDFTQVGEDGTRSVLGGEYGWRFGVAETRGLGQGYAERSVECV